jgi:toxin ParE1/3/4
MILQFLPASREELDAAASYLNERSAGLGAELLDDVERTASLAREFPGIGRPIDPIHRQIPLQRFSYYLAYRVHVDVVLVVAVAHKRRRPGYWRSRR